MPMTWRVIPMTFPEGAAVIEVFEMPLWFKESGLQIIGMKGTSDASPFHLLFPGRETTHLISDRSGKTHIGAAVTCREEYIFILISMYEPTLSLNELALQLTDKFEFVFNGNSKRKQYPSRKEFCGF